MQRQAITSTTFMKNMINDKKGTMNQIGMFNEINYEFTL